MATSTFNAVDSVRANLQGQPSYVPSRTSDDARPLIRLDMNESPYGPSPKARAALASFDEAHRYPDFGQSRLLAALSRYTGVPAAQIIAGAGLDDVLTSLAHLILDAGDEVIISEPTFGVYRMIVALHAGTTVNVPLTAEYELDGDSVLGATTARTKLIVICTPNNPTGNALSEDAVEKICREAPCLVAIDEAYAEFAGLSHISLMERYPENVLIFRTLSKFAGLAGMRVGYGLFPRSLEPYLHHVTPPFHNVSVASAVAAVASLDDLEYLNGIVRRIVADRDALSDQLREINGVFALPSNTNFLLVRLRVENAAPVVAELANRGIIVRHFGRPELGLLDCLRVTVGTTAENETFVSALHDILIDMGAAA